MEYLEKDDIESLKLKAGSCYGCHNYPGGDYKLCDEFHNIAKMKKLKSPCYDDNVHVMNNFAAHDEYGNIEIRSY
jgi:hypothetical protein